MSTRCQVQVIEGMGDNLYQKVTLYHHFDGYPSNMLPLIHKAYELSGGGWEAGRAGKMASFLCAADPGQFEPEAGHDLHSGDIAYFYTVKPSNNDKSSDAHPQWIVTAYDPPFDCKGIEDMTELASGLSAEMAPRKDAEVRTSRACGAVAQERLFHLTSRMDPL